MSPEEYQDAMHGAIKQWSKEVPMRKCDVCGLVRRQDMMLNFAMIVGSPGHPDIPPFQCKHGEHWACSLAHFEDIVMHCAIDEIKTMIAYLHGQVLPDAGKASPLFDEAQVHLAKVQADLAEAKANVDASTPPTGPSA